MRASFAISIVGAVSSVLAGGARRTGDEGADRFDSVAAAMRSLPSSGSSLDILVDEIEA